MAIPSLSSSAVSCGTLRLNVSTYNKTNKNNYILHVLNTIFIDYLLKLAYLATCNVGMAKPNSVKPQSSSLILV